MAVNPCPPPGKTLNATNGMNNYQITVVIADDVRGTVPPDEQLQIISILNNTPVSIMAGLAGKGNGIKRESNGWCIHNQANKSLYDLSIKPGDAAKKSFLFNAYKKRPH